MLKFAVGCVRTRLTNVTIPQMKSLLFIFSALAALGSIVSSCASGTEGITEVMDSDDVLDRMLYSDSFRNVAQPLEEMPDPTVGLPTRHLGDYGKLFNDSNYVHWAEGERIGIEPLGDTRSHLFTRRPLVKIVSNPDFHVAKLTYSVPYLVPEAAAMLHEIGRRFNDSLERRGGGAYRIKVTSVTRTPACVARLRRVNPNAVDSSVHKLATTVDISYSNFVCDNADVVHRSAADMKNLLAEVLLAMREEGKCLVKYEYKQACFHITCTSRYAYGRKQE